MRTLLFDRFISTREPGFDGLARDLADLIGARRPFRRTMPGLLNWGIAGLTGLNPSSQQDRLNVARQMEAAITEFEPRLQDVRVTPVDGVTDFAFQLEATFTPPDDETFSVRILAPRRGGGLGAEVVMFGHRSGGGAS